MKYLVSYVPSRKEEVINKLEYYGKIVYRSDILNVVGVKTHMDIITIKHIAGVTRVDVGISGKL
ncbi:hypothetical protein ACIQ1D_19180 [Lysinibacillus xylanilyticus]|uniref:hypothetical protein n=1 Tax=Lysinibacillus xylanilyticus TaxID=582475 RepID=UPI003812023B